MGDPWTIRRVLAWTTADFSRRGIDSPRLDAELLLAHSLDIDRVTLYLDHDRPLSTGELEAFRALVARRRDREPVAYILGRREFYGRSFAVSRAVLIPRPETETLVERAIELVGARVLDLCTGSGIIGISILAERPEVEADLTDISEAALEVARANAERHGVSDRARFWLGDLFAAVPDEGVRYSLITANPPYVTEAEIASLAPEIVRFEPRGALVAGADGLAIIRRIANEAPAYLEAGGHLLAEIAENQSATVIDFLSEHPTHRWNVRSVKDLSGVERVIEAQLLSG